MEQSFVSQRGSKKAFTYPCTIVAAPSYQSVWISVVQPAALARAWTVCIHAHHLSAPDILAMRMKKKTWCFLKENQLIFHPNISHRSLFSNRGLIARPSGGESREERGEDCDRKTEARRWREGPQWTRQATPSRRPRHLVPGTRHLYVICCACTCCVYGWSRARDYESQMIAGDPSLRLRGGSAKVPRGL